MKLVRNLFRVRKKRHMFALAVCALITVIAALSVLWGSSLIDLPPAVVHAARLALTKVAVEPPAAVKLDIPFHRQEHSLSCEAATLRMALLGYGLDIPESEILRSLPFDATPREGDEWGDPYQGFVGNIDGKMMVDGYGVYWEPLARTASRWAYADVIEDGTVGDLVEHLAEGHPIIVWGYLGRGQKVSWTTPAGRRIEAVNGEHTRLVIGFDGSASDPAGFFVIDPVYGHQYWEREKFLHNWDAFGRMGVVVYPPLK